MLNGIRTYRQEDRKICWLVTDNRGLIGLPIWLDRKTTQRTFQRFKLDTKGDFREDAWVTIKTHH